MDTDYISGETKTGSSSDSETKLAISVLVGYNFNNFFVESNFDIMDPYIVGIKGGLWFDIKNKEQY
ncbi:MAG: hypothetical protein ACOC1K_06810 [Nanoarchaeota archaeon]